MTVLDDDNPKFKTMLTPPVYYELRNSTSFINLNNDPAGEEEEESEPPSCSQTFNDIDSNAESGNSAEQSNKDSESSSASRSHSLNEDQTETV